MNQLGRGRFLKAILLSILLVLNAAHSDKPPQENIGEGNTATPIQHLEGSEPEVIQKGPRQVNVKAGQANPTSGRRLDLALLTEYYNTPNRERYQKYETVFPQVRASMKSEYHDKFIQDRNSTQLELLRDDEYRGKGVKAMDRAIHVVIRKETFSLFHTLEVVYHGAISERMKELQVTDADRANFITRLNRLRTEDHQDKAWKENLEKVVDQLEGWQLPSSLLLGKGSVMTGYSAGGWNTLSSHLGKKYHETLIGD